MKTSIILGSLLVLASSVLAQQPKDSLNTNYQRHRFERPNSGDSTSRRSGYGYGRSGRPGRNWESRGRGSQRFARNRQSADGLAYVQLTPGQREQLAGINRKYQEESAALYKKDDLTLGAYKSRLVAMQKERKAKIEALLTDQQKERRAAALKRRAEDEQVRSAARLERMRIRLNLNNQQTADLRSQQEKFRQQMESIRQNDDLLPMQKKDQVRTLVLAQRNALRSLLTPEQISQLELMRKQRFSRS